jgi:hypothetical protein
VVPQDAQIFSAAKERKDRKEGPRKAQSLCALCSFVAVRLRSALGISAVQVLFRDDAKGIPVADSPVPLRDRSAQALHRQLVNRRRPRLPQFVVVFTKT